MPPPATGGTYPQQAQCASFFGGDAVQNWNPPGSPFGCANGAGAFGNANPIQNLLQQLVAIVQQLMGSLSGSSGTQQFFTGANASSNGDPHLRFNGTTESGAQNARFDSMTSHRDLLESDSFTGGYRVSTQTTQPQANGVTYNKRATVTTNFGNTKIFLDNDGTAGVLNNGEFTQLQNGRSLNLGNGEVATRNQNGTLTIVQTNSQGGSITTIMTQNGEGVDVTAQAHDVDLGGDLVAASTPPGLRRPLWGAAAGPQPGQLD